MSELDRWMSHKRYLYILAKVSLVVLVLGVFWWLFGRLHDILVPLGASILIAYLLDPMVDWFEERGVNRTLAIFVLLLIGLGILTVFVLVITPTLVDEVTILATEKVPKLATRVRSLYAEYSGVLKEKTGYALPATFGETFASYGKQIQAYLGEALNKVTTVTTSVLESTWAAVAYALNILMVPLFVFYYLRDFDVLKEKLVHLIPLPHRDRVVNKARRVDEVVGHWFRGQVTVAVILGVLYAIGLFICDIKLGITIGLLAGILNVVPYLGFLIGIGLAVLMSLLDDGSGWGQLIGVAVVFGVVQTLEGYIITPKIVGEKVGLSPLMVIVVLLVGAELFGLWGILLAIPVTGALRVFFLDAVADYKRSKFFLGEENYVRLMTSGVDGVGDDVRDALEQAAEVDLDLHVDNATPQELQELSAAVMRGRTEYAGVQGKLASRVNTADIVKSHEASEGKIGNRVPKGSKLDRMMSKESAHVEDSAEEGEKGEDG